jgi:hypothetical protein
MAVVRLLCTLGIMGTCSIFCRFSPSVELIHCSSSLRPTKYVPSIN